jgi:hypothetical protein
VPGKPVRFGAEFRVRETAASARTYASTNLKGRTRSVPRQAVAVQREEHVCGGEACPLVPIEEGLALGEMRGVAHDGYIVLKGG